ncbi:LuxR C-terminal-related transcriptional regulator [Paenibacillus tarimensis]
MRSVVPNTRLLITKITVPHVSRSVERPLLWKKLDEGMQKKLVLVTAPAGFGKSTLLADWIRTGRIPAAWVSLDRGDNDFPRFAEYLSAAIRSIHEDIGNRLTDAIHHAGALSPESFMTLLINEVQPAEEHIHLILDDYHLIEEAAVHRALDFLLNYMPANLHLYISSRSEPQHSLSEMFAKGHMITVSIDDLRFNTEEIRAYFKVAGCDLPANADLQTIASYTEGWIAGLQMMQLAKSDFSELTIRDQRNPDFQNLYILNYLAEEVLLRQSAKIQRFMMRTSIPERINCELCRKLTGEEDSRDILDYLEKSGLFLIPLDGQGNWYRYHHMFSDFLRNRLNHTETADQVENLHRMASTWFSEAGFFSEAVDHALAGEDYTSAASLIIGQAPEFFHRGEFHTILRWLKKLPESFVTRMPGLSIIYAWALQYTGQVDKAEQVIQAAETFFQSEEGERALFGKKEDVRAHFAAIRCGICFLRGETEKGFQYVRHVSENLPHGGTFFTTGIDFNPRGESLLRGMLGCMGALRQSLILHQYTLNSWKSEKNIHYGVTLAILAECFFETNKLEKAEELANAAISIALEHNHMSIFMSAMCTRIRIKRSLSETEAASALFQEAELQIRRERKHQYMANLLALKTRTNIVDGQHDQVSRWVRDCRVQSDGYLEPEREYEHITYLRAIGFLQRGRSAIVYAERLLQAAERGGRKASVIELNLLLALMHDQLNQLVEAEKKVSAALKIACEEGYIRIFLDEGNRSHRLLSRFLLTLPGGATENSSPSRLHLFVQELLQQFGASGSHLESGGIAEEKLVNLTRQEKNVLHLLSLGLANKDIAGQLCISPETVKLHCKHIYKKLNVHNRAQIIAQFHQK